MLDNVQHKNQVNFSESKLIAATSRNEKRTKKNKIDRCWTQFMVYVTHSNQLK